MELNKLIYELPKALRLVRGAEKTAYLVVKKDKKGWTWTAAYQGIVGNKVDGFFAEGDTPEEALQGLKERREAHETVSSLSGW